tara:strand:+ start:19407 stop:19781 length:375 start_codon:yes stop_codon:yes gene_type:complete
MEEDIFYCGEAVTNPNEAAWSCFVKGPEKIWRFKTFEEFRRDGRLDRTEGRMGYHPIDWNSEGSMNYLMGKPVQPELASTDRYFKAVLEVKEGKFHVYADDDVDPDRESWTVDYQDIIYDYPVK